MRLKKWLVGKLVSEIEWFQNERDCKKLQGELDWKMRTTNDYMIQSDTHMHIHEWYCRSCGATQ